MDNGKLKGFSRFEIEDKNERKSIAYFNDLKKAKSQIRVCERL